MRERPDAAVAMAARAGDRHASEQPIRDCLPLVHNTVGRALDGHSDAYDAVQETMVRALDGMPELQPPDFGPGASPSPCDILDQGRRGLTPLTAEPLKENAQEAEPQADSPTWQSFGLHCRAIDVNDWKTANGSPVQLWTALGNATQRWSRGQQSPPAWRHIERTGPEGAVQANSPAECGDSISPAHRQHRPRPTPRYGASLGGKRCDQTGRFS